MVPLQVEADVAIRLIGVNETMRNECGARNTIVDQVMADRIQPFVSPETVREFKLIEELLCTQRSQKSHPRSYAKSSGNGRSLAECARSAQHIRPPI